MTDPTNWPNPERPGVPMFPERDGWHSLRGKNSRGVKAAYWLSDRAAYAPSDIKEERAYADSNSVVSDCYNYIGPCLTPTQIAELVAGERERCAKAATEVSNAYYNEREETECVDEQVYADERMCAAQECAEAIRNLRPVT